MRDDDNIERLLREQHRDQRKAIPRPPVGKVRPKTIRMPGDMIDKRRDPQYRAGPVYTYKLPVEAQSPKEAEVVVNWFKPERQDRRRLELSVYVRGDRREVHLRLSAALREALAQRGNYIAIGLAKPGNLLAVKAVTDPNEGWRLPSRGDKLTASRLYDILASYAGRHTMRWDDAAGCWVSTAVRPLRIYRRQKAG